MTKLQGPEILDIPQKLIPIITDLNSYRYFLLEGGRGGGKCFAPDTPILLFDGSIKPIKHIKVGDYVRGKDNTRRKVLSVHIGFSEMFSVKQYYGDDYIVNAEHLLCLKKNPSCSQEKRKSKVANKYIKPRNRYNTYNDEITISVKDFLSKSRRWQETFRGYKSKEIEYPTRKVLIDPYYLGVWVGDGNSDCPTRITTADIEILDFLESYAKKLKLKLVKYSKYGYGISKGEKVFGRENPLLNNFRLYGLVNNKHIPKEYLTNDLTVRRAVLAGIIDTDGTKRKNRKGSYQITQKSELLIKQIKQLADSIGLITSISIKFNKKYNQNYFNLSIRGDLSKIPIRIKRKQQRETEKNIDGLSRLQIKSIGMGEYYGFTVDGDNEFILPDRTVVHNSQSVGRFILYLAEHYNIRIVCGRETQNSINESVYSLLVDLIRKYNLAFEVFSTKITHKVSGTTVAFRGFREQGAFNIQGMEGIDIVWIDEAQAITKQTLDVLIPTIRKDKAKIFFTMNPHVIDDPVVSFCMGRKDCLHIKINYDENKYCTQALINEAEECKKKSIEDYNHIWLGQPLDKSEDAVFSYESLMASMKAHYPLRQGYGYRIAGFDVARYGDDKCAAVIIQQMGALHWETIFVDEWGQRDLSHTTGKILEIANEYNADKCIIDEDGIGAGPLDMLQKGRGLDYFIGFKNPTISYADNKEYANNRTVNAYKCRDMIVKGHLCITDESLVKELMSFKYTFDHNQRRILVSKDKMRKLGVKSPNLADGLIMAVSLVGEIKQAQDTQYWQPVNQTAEDNLFKLAGVM